MAFVSICLLVARQLWRLQHGTAHGLGEGRVMLDRHDRNPHTGAAFPPRPSRTSAWPPSPCRRFHPPSRAARCCNAWVRHAIGFGRFFIIAVGCFAQRLLNLINRKAKHFDGQQASWPQSVWLHTGHLPLERAVSAAGRRMNIMNFIEFRRCGTCPTSS